MYKKSFYLAAVLSASMFAACQDNPTQVNSTQHKHPNQTSGVHSTDSNGSIHSEPNDASHRESTTDNEMMNHSTMKSAPNAAAQPFDLQFLDTMIAHHEGAIEMGRAAETKAQNTDVKSFAAKIVADQTREINEMKRLREQWFAGKPSALNMEMKGMADSMKEMNMAALNTPTGKDFDLEFVKQMSPHHEGAVVMAREALAKAEHAELKTLANQIIAAQEAEIKTMQDWKVKWSK